jgi:2-keto-3-deoxy-L-rhamnonate aldolase RhmA
LSKISTLAADRYETAAFAKISHAASIRVMCAIAGMDAIILDTEHGAFTEAELEAHCALISALGVMPVIRVARPEANLIARAIDRGARGVMVPQAESVDQVESALRGMELAPVGARGWDPTVSANQYGAYSGAAAQVRCFIQIETAAALAHAGQSLTRARAWRRLLQPSGSVSLWIRAREPIGRSPSATPFWPSDRTSASFAKAGSVACFDLLPK